MRLVSAESVKEIICKYENRMIQRSMIFDIEKLQGVLATNEQEVEILGNEDIEFKDNGGEKDRYKRG